MSLQATLMPPCRFPATSPPARSRDVGDRAVIGYAHSMRDPSDEELMQRYAKGDAAAFETLYPRYREPLYRYFIRHVREPALANDLYQGCWEKVIRARETFRTASPFRAWLFRIAHNHLVDYHRSNRPADPLEAGRHPSPEHSPDEHASGAEQERQFREQLALLPPEQRDALLLRFESGLGLEEIGAISGVNTETVKSRLRYATRKLKQALQS